MPPVAAARIRYREQALRSLGQLPPFSPILNRLLATMADEDVPFARLAELIEKDTVLAGHVLRLVNSAIYGRRGTISSVGHALSLLGLNKLRNLALSLSIANLWARVHTPKTWSGAQFNLHSGAAAVFSDLLALRLEVDYAEGAFAAGLLHDLGKLLMAIALGEEYEEIDNLYQTGGLTMEECELEVIGITHAQLSALALAQWNLPKQIQEAVAYHHRIDPLASQSLHLSRVVQAADAFVNHLEVTLAPTTSERRGSPEEILDDLGLADQAGALAKAFQTEFETLRRFF